MKFQEIVEKIKIKFFPIWDIENDEIYGYEVIFDNIASTSFINRDSLFDYAYKNIFLYKLDFDLRKKMLDKYCNSNFEKDKILFYELDNRILEMPDYKKGNTLKILKHYQLKPNNICFNISEKHEFVSIKNMLITLKAYKEQNYKISVNNFGVRFSNIKLLYNIAPDYLFIDSFLTSDLKFDRKKQVLVENIVNLCKTFGITLVTRGEIKEDNQKILENFGIPFIQKIPYESKKNRNNLLK